MCDHKTAEMKYQLVFRRHCITKHCIAIDIKLIHIFMKFYVLMKVTKWASID